MPAVIKSQQKWRRRSGGRTRDPPRRRAPRPTGRGNTHKKKKKVLARCLHNLSVPLRARKGPICAFNKCLFARRHRRRVVGRPGGDRAVRARVLFAFLAASRRPTGTPPDHRHHHHYPLPITAAAATSHTLD